MEVLKVEVGDLPDGASQIFPWAETRPPSSASSNPTPGTGGGGAVTPVCPEHPDVVFLFMVAE